MPVPPGTRLGPYEVTGRLGAGGMGEVYRARDTKLGREVALKILPDAFADDPDRLMRFEREARTLASLNHPHIAQVYGIEDSPSTGSGQAATRALVMELVDGDDLSARIARGAIPLDEALPIAAQIADALEAAHEAGIIHRDLKPANIKVRDDGTVKVLDFGLAKALDQDSRTSGPQDLASSPTITSPALTMRGVILGTAAYMAPEQAKGKPVDKRADIWAFGCVLYEMLTGQRAFKGDDITDTITAVLRDEPDWSALGAVSPGVQRVLRACLEKDARRRLRDIGDVRVWLDGAEAAAADARPTTRTSRWWMAVAGAAVVAAAVLGTFVGMRAAPAAERRVLAVELGLPPDAPISGMAITPDGSQVVVVGGSGTRLLVRSLDALEPVEIARGSNITFPFVSPDGRWVGYVDESTRLMKAAVSGGRGTAVAILDGRVLGATWLDERTIVASTTAGTGLLRVAADGGAAPVAITTPEQGLDHVSPVRLPDGHSVLFNVVSRSDTRDRLQGLQRLDVNTGRITTVLEGGGSDARPVPSGHLAYLDGGRLMVLPFDHTDLVVAPDATPRDTGIRASAYAVSNDGTLVYAEPDPNVNTMPRSLVWVDDDGRETEIAAEARPYQYPQVSPDGRRVAVAALGDGSDIWLLDVATSAVTRLTFDASTETAPVWTPDGGRIVFASTRDSSGFNLWWQPADGTGRAERLTEAPYAQFPTTVTPDGRHAIFWETSAAGGRDLKMIALDGSKHVTTVLETPGTAEHLAALSPDGRWLAFESDSSGQREVFVRPFPDVGRGLWQISSGGGRQPAWSRAGDEVFYLGSDGGVMRTRVSEQAGAFRAAPPQRLLEPRYYGARLATLVARTYDVMPGGRRFIAIKAPSGQNTTGRPDIVLVQHWSDTLAPRAVRGSSHTLKYWLALVVAGECVLRYDNEAGKGDHRHVGDRELPYAFSSAERLLMDFWTDVDTWRQGR